MSGSILHTAMSAFTKSWSKFTPLIINELLGGRDIKKLMLYVTFIVLGIRLLSYIQQLSMITMEKYDERFQIYFTTKMSRRVMELDFQLTEDKIAFDQIAAAQTGMTWYSGGVHGISQQVFYIISNVIKFIGVIILIIMHAPLLFVVSAILIIINTWINNKINKVEIDSYKKLSKLNRI